MSSPWLRLVCPQPSSWLVLFHDERIRGRLRRWDALDQLRFDHRCNLFPDSRIILDFVMRPVQVAGNPGIVITINVTTLIRHAKVADNIGAFRIRGANTRTPMDEAFRLIKVDG